MAFLDNSTAGIILDAVLTTKGRLRIASGDGGFKITEFALGDDEINYALYDATASTGAESTTIRQMPVFEALTNSDVSLKYKLLNITQNNLLYLPILKLNNLDANTKMTSNGYFAVCVDTDTENEIFKDGPVDGVLAGANPSNWKQYIKVDQGLDTTQVDFSQELQPDLIETNYMVKLDNRLGYPVTLDDTGLAASTIDDAQIATYDSFLAEENTMSQPMVELISNTTDSKNMVIAGSRGTSWMSQIRATLGLQNSTFLFIQQGAEMAASVFRAGSTETLYYIDTTMTVEGFDTGYRKDIHLKFIKLKEA